MSILTIISLFVAFTAIGLIVALALIVNGGAKIPEPKLLPIDLKVKKPQTLKSGWLKTKED